MIDETTKNRIVKRILEHTVKKKIKGSQLSREFGLDTSKVRLIVHEERLSGKINLGSSIGGYFRIEDREGWNITRAHLISRIRKTADVLSVGDKHFKYYANKNQIWAI